MNEKKQKGYKSIRKPQVKKKMCFNCTGKELKPIKKETKDIDMMMYSTTRKLEVYHVEISELSGKFKIN